MPLLLPLPPLLPLLLPVPSIAALSSSDANQNIRRRPLDKNDMEMPPDEIGRMERAAKYWRGLYHLQSVTNVKIEFGKSGAGETGEICRFLPAGGGGQLTR